MAHLEAAFGDRCKWLSGRSVSSLLLECLLLFPLDLPLLLPLLLILLQAGEINVAKTNNLLANHREWHICRCSSLAVSSFARSSAYFFFLCPFSASHQMQSKQTGFQCHKKGAQKFAGGPKVALETVCGLQRSGEKGAQ